MYPLRDKILAVEKPTVRRRMKFLIDAHLPPSLKNVFQAAGHDAIHTSDLTERNLTRDSILNEISLEEQRVIVTKDSDFYYSHLLQGRPWKLLFVKTGNMSLTTTKETFINHLQAIVTALETCSLVELSSSSVSPNPPK